MFGYYTLELLPHFPGTNELMVFFNEYQMRDNLALVQGQVLWQTTN